MAFLSAILSRTTDKQAKACSHFTPFKRFPDTTWVLKPSYLFILHGGLPLCVQDFEISIQVPTCEHLFPSFSVCNTQGVLDGKGSQTSVLGGTTE